MPPGLGQTSAFDLVQEGRERRSTGSHYTPPELVAPLIQHALEPVLDGRISAGNSREQKEQTILALKVCDISCGSGHFLLAAARRLGKELARVRTSEDEPAPERVREAVRDVISHCIYGVDKNPLAVELCRVALWLESHAEGKPLTFLDHRIRCGDSLVGVFDLEVLEHGIPDEAFKPVTGEDKTAAREAKKRNARERADSLLNYPVTDQIKQIAERLRALDALPEDTIEQVRAKADAYLRIEHGSEFERLRFACDVWTAAFFQPYLSAGSGPLTTETLRTALTNGHLADARLAGFVLQTADECHFFHWPLAFPEVFASGGFDVILGNPPFLGGLRISTEFGDKYRQWVSIAFDPFPGTADLCAAFFRRAFKALNLAGRFGLIATNTISQGDTREGGLALIKRDGGLIVFAKRFVKWPGQANVEVNLTALSKRTTPVQACLDDQLVPEISSRLDSEPENEPNTLRQNRDKCFIGDFVRGIGFVVESEEAGQLLAIDQNNSRCLMPYLNGEDFNNDYQQRPARYVVCFHDYTFEQAEQYPALLAIVRERVKPFRDSVREKNERENWWLFARYRGELRQAIRGLRRFFVRSRVSEYHMLAFVPTSLIVSEQVVVFAFDDDDYFAVLQSNVHEAWVWKNASSLESRNRYTPTDCFETFAFPQAPAESVRTEAERLGEAYHEHRRQVMLSHQLGLTKTCNLFHNPQCTDADIARMRELHAAMDHAILACYGWTDLDPGHDFHQNERGQIRFTIGPIARREVLRRLLALNLEIAAREVTTKGNSREV